MRVQPNHGRAHRAVANTFGMQHAEVSVRSLESEWPFPIGCSILPTAYCWKDCGLCCYAVSCPLCVHAEVAVQNDIKGFCGAESMMMHILSVLGIETIVFPLSCVVCCATGVCCCLGPILGGVVRGAYHTQVRDGFKAKYGLPIARGAFAAIHDILRRGGAERRGGSGARQHRGASAMQG